MKIRELQKEDVEQVKEIFEMYWTDPEFRNGLAKKLIFFLERGDEYKNTLYRFYVAEEEGEIVGVAGMRKAPDHMVQFAKTEYPLEFYVLASKYKRKGIGKALRLKRIEEAKKLGFTEVVFYSPDSHKDSWSFHDGLGFERVGAAIAPDGEPGMIWRKGL